MSRQTAFISMEKASRTCTQLGEKIEQYMFSDPYMVFELATQYVTTIEQKTNEYFERNLDKRKEHFMASAEGTNILMKMKWIQEIRRQSLSEHITISTFNVINCYQFLLEITYWYLNTFEKSVHGSPHIKKLQLTVQEQAFRKHDPVWKQISKTDTRQQDRIQNQEESNRKTISYKNSVIYIPKNKESIKLDQLEIKGCNHLLRELKLKNIHTLKDLPKQLDDIYLQLTGIGPTTVKKMWNQLMKLFSSKIITSDNHKSINENRMIRFSGETIELNRDLVRLPIREKDFPGSIRAITSMKQNGIHTYGDLPVHFLELKRLPGIGRIRVKKLFNQMRELFPRLEEERSLQDLTNDERILHKTEQYVEWFLKIEENNQFAKKEKIPDRYVRIISKRYKAELAHKHITLQQLGDSEGITRERVRQIINHGNKLVANKWKTYIEYVRKKIELEGNILIKDRYLSHTPSDYIMVQAFGLEGIYLHEKNGMHILTQTDECSFNKIIEEIKENFHTTFNLKIIDEKTYTEYCKEQAEVYLFPEVFINKVISEWIHWIDQTKGILKNVPKVNIVEMVMLNYPNGVAIYKEEERLNKEANKFMPGKFTSKRDFTSVFSRGEINNRLLLWARGVYIHRGFIVAEKSWIQKVQQKAHELLVKKEFIHVRKLFKLIEEEAQEQQVPNEYALFSLMRLYDEKLLSLERFPIIQLLGERRVDNDRRVVNYIDEKERRVTKQELIQYFVEKRGWRTFTIEQVLSDSSEIIQYEQGVYTLISYYESIKAEQMKPFFIVLEKMLKASGVVSVHTLFRCQMEHARTLEINTPYLLYALLKKWNHVNASFERFPYILPNNASNESISNRVLIEEFIAEQRSIVTRQEMIDWLTTITESGESTLDCSLNTSQEILYYKRGQYGEYVHRNTVGLDDEKEKELLVAVEKVYNELKNKTGKKYMLLQDIYHHIKLPTLANGIKWSDVLLADFIKASKWWHVFGSYDEIYMPIDLECENDIDFINHLVQTEFNGAISLSSLRLYLAQIRYSSTGEFRAVVQNALLKQETPFVLESECIVHKRELKSFRAKLETVK